MTYITSNGEIIGHVPASLCGDDRIIMILSDGSWTEFGYEVDGVTYTVGDILQVGEYVNSRGVTIVGYSQEYGIQWWGLNQSSDSFINGYSARYTDVGSGMGLGWQATLVMWITNKLNNWFASENEVEEMLKTPVAKPNAITITNLYPVSKSDSGIIIMILTHQFDTVTK
ncbi:MAG: hypothetical protein LBC49_05515, partial [Bacteroidales bacterium]|nr:hypothetical protein [Bacteroidales bacterium]